MKFFQDLFGDLRDRNLLPLIAALIVAIIVIPMLLSEDPAPAPESGLLGAGGDELVADAPETERVVIPGAEGIRDFEERLEDFKRRNPFKQQFTGPTEAEQAAEAAADAAAGAVGGGSSGGDFAPGTSPDDLAPGGQAVPGGTGDSGGSGSGGSGGSGSGGSGSSGSGGSGGSGGTTEVLLSSEIDVKAGPVGDAKKKNKLKPLSFIPGEKRPVIQFIQGNFEADRAVFVVSRNVEDTSGEGNCAPSNRDCQFIRMKEGEEHRFVYEPDGRTYRVKLRNVRLVEEKIDRNSKRAADRFESASGYAGISAQFSG